MAITEDAGDSLDGLGILVLELFVLKITNEKWADRIHFVQFNSEYGAKENIIKIERKIEMKKSNWKLVLIIVAGILAVVMTGVFGVQSSQNKAFSLEEQVNTADSDIKVQEKRRVDLIYNLADCVKQYDKHEADTLTAIVEGRGSTGDIENVTTAIAAVSEAYPELKSNENYKELMNELSITENLIAEYRSNYNKQIKVYRRYVRKFPTRIFLDILGYEVQEYTYLDYDAPVDAPQNLFGE